DLPVGLGGPQAREVVPEQVLGDHRRVRLELADPPAARMLELEQPYGRALESEVEGGALGDGGHAGTLVARDNTARAAARPLRTAFSIVGGQPSEDVHAPARATPAETAPAGGRSIPGRRAMVASGSRLTRDQSTSACPRRSTSCRAMRSTSSRPRSSISSGAPLETTVRYWPRSGRRPVIAPRSKTQWASEQRRAASSCLRMRRSKSRWTLTIGDVARPGSGSPSRSADSDGGTATTNASASSSSSDATRSPVRTVVPA